MTFLVSITLRLLNPVPGTTFLPTTLFSISELLTHPFWTLGYLKSMVTPYRPIGGYTLSDYRTLSFDLLKSLLLLCPYFHGLFRPGHQTHCTSLRWWTPPTSPCRVTVLLFHFQGVSSPISTNTILSELPCDLPISLSNLVNTLRYLRTWKVQDQVDTYNYRILKFK